MKKLFILLFAFCVLAGCAEKKPLAVLTIAEDEPLTIDIRDEFKPSAILSEVEEGTEVAYFIDEENSKVVITLTKGKRTETLEKSVEIQYPLGCPFSEDITIDTYVGYDVNELVSSDEDVEVVSVLDEENSKLIVTFTRGDREETIEIPVELTSSEPNSRTYSYYRYVTCGYKDVHYYGTMTFYKDGTTRQVINGVEYRGTYGDGWVEVGTPHNEKLSFSDDYSSFHTISGSACTNGEYDEFGGELISVD